MNYDTELLNKLKLFNSTHRNKGNEIIIGIDAYRYFKRQIKNNNNPDFYKAKFDDRGILREILGMTIKIDYMIPYIIEIRHNPYLKSSVDFIWLSKEEIESVIPNDELCTLIDNDLKDLHKFLEFERYYEDRNNKEEWLWVK